MTGLRVEELTELTHHSLVQYRLPGTGELIPLLHIVPSKTDTERLLVVSPELADVLSAVICRIRDDAGAVPLAVTYDYHERVYGPPMPILFQHRVGLENRQISAPAIRKLLDLALAAAGLTDTAGQPLRLIPHDFRRIFITDAVMNGMPPHIAQLVAGHADINTTMGYKAVYLEEAINGHRAFLARRRALRPAGNTGCRPTRNGRNSSATSPAARSRSATAAGPTAPAASTSTAASGARCCGPTQPSGPGWPTCATTSRPASAKPSTKAGSAKPKA
jgi:integrase